MRVMIQCIAMVVLLIDTLNSLPQFQRTFSEQIRRSSVFGLISDVHLLAEPKADCSKYSGTYSNVGCDSDVELAETAIDSLYNRLATVKQGEASFILYLGDSSWHFRRTNVTKDTATIYNLTRAVFEKFQNKSPGTPVIVALGNNDFPIKYHLDMSEFYPIVIDLYRDMASVDGVSQVADDFKSTFSRGGYFSVKVQTPKVRVFSLNTLYFTTSVKNTTSQKVYGDEQLEWVEETLASLDDDERVIFIGHHPPGISLFYLFKYAMSVGQWSPPLLHRFINITTNYQSRIISNFFGHCHADFLNFAKDQMVAMTSPSVSPIYGGQPSYQLALLDKSSMVLNDLITFHTWLDYYKRLNVTPKFDSYSSLRLTLNTKDLSLESMINFKDRLLLEDTLPVHTLLKTRMYQARFSPVINPHVFYCFTVNLERAAFMKCLEKFRSV